MLKSRLPKIALELEVLMEEVIEDGAEDIERDAEARVAVDTGRLRSRIHIEKEPEGVYVVAGDDEAWYGHLVEYGANSTPPHPYLIPALEQNRGQIVARGRTVLRSL